MDKQQVKYPALMTEEAMKEIRKRAEIQKAIREDRRKSQPSLVGPWRAVVEDILTINGKDGMPRIRTLLVCGHEAWRAELPAGVARCKHCHKDA